MPIHLVLLLSALALAPGSASPGRLPVTGDVGPATPSSDVSEWIAAASEPVNTPRRSAARDALFRQAYPQLLAQGAPASQSDVAALADATRGVACASGAVRVRKAVVKGDLAYVAMASDGGGCSWLMRRDGAGWAPLMPLGWTLHD